MIHEGAESCRIHGLIEIGIFQHDERGLAAQLQQNGLEMSGCLSGDNPADLGGAGEINAADGRVCDEGGDDFRCVVWRIGDHIGDACRKTASFRILMMR